MARALPRSGGPHVVGVARDTASRWEGTGLRSDRVSVALTGIDLDRYVPAPADERASTRRRLGIAEDAFVVLYAGRIGREKGVDVLVRAFALVTARRPGSRLVVVGSPSLGPTRPTRRATKPSCGNWLTAWP